MPLTGPCGGWTLPGPPADRRVTERTDTRAVPKSHRIGSSSSLRAGRAWRRTGRILNALAFLLASAVTAVPTVLADGEPPASEPPRVFGIGDSVMLGGSGALEQSIDGVEIDAAVSRQAATGINILRARAAAGVTEDVLIFHLGNNGPLTRGQIDDVMAAAPGVAHVIFVTLAVPRAWETSNNAILADGVARYSNAQLADWHAIGAGRLDLLWSDGVHLRPQGAYAYAALLAPLALAPNRF